MSLRARARAVQTLLKARYAGPYSEERTWVVCNGCGALVGASSIEALQALTTNWRIGEDFGDLDFCPDCKERWQ